MPAAISIGLFVLCLATIGAGVRTVAAADAHPDRPMGPLFEDAFLSFLSGVAVVSVLLMVLALLNAFSIGAIAGAVLLVLVAAGYHRWKRRGSYGSSTRSCVLGLLAVAFAVTLARAIVPPYEARLNGSDASVYLGMASHIIRTGGLRGHDPLVAEMSLEERRTLFRNRFPGDATGPYARFPGGVKLVDPSRATVSFHFYHLWPIWLALGGATLGSPESLALLSMFVATSVLSLFLLARRLAGNGFALAATALVFFSFPEVYYSRLPVSELPAQAYFLGGLICFLGAMEDAPRARREYLKLVAGALWGCLCLVRVDGILFLVPALVCSFLLLRDLRRSLADWTPFAVVLLLFVSLAMLHHIAAGSYSLSADLPLLGGLLHGGGSWLMDAEPALVAAWVTAAVGGALLRSARARRLVAALGGTAAVLFLLITVVWFAAFVGRFEWSQVLRHLGWLSLYLPGPVMPAIGMGLALLAIRLPREPSRAAAIVFVLLMVPLVSLLVRPMVTATQPWAIRRFVPMVFPLLLTLALLGWHQGLAVAGRRFGRVLDRGYILLAAGGVALSLPLSGPLWGEPLYADLDDQVRVLAARIPRDALVIIPDEDAGTHMQTSLQYGEGRSMLVLPLRVETDAARSAAMDEFLARQMGSGRRVIALLQNTPRPPAPVESRFGTTVLFSQSISFLELPQVTDSQRSATKVRSRIRYYAFELRRASETPLHDDLSGTLAAGIDFSRPVLPREVAATAGISHAEPDGRWTDGPVVRLRFTRPLPARFSLELDIANVYPPNRGQPLRARVGSAIREARLPDEHDTVRLAFVAPQPRDTIELRIPHPTSPASRLESSDRRRLGIRLKRFRVVSQPE
jgi:hypothetical protein